MKMNNKKNKKKNNKMNKKSWDLLIPNNKNQIYLKK